MSGGGQDQSFARARLPRKPLRKGAVGIAGDMKPVEMGGKSIKDIENTQRLRAVAAAAKGNDERS
jgi:hypothetical protein